MLFSQFCFCLTLFELFEIGNSNYYFLLSEKTKIQLFDHYSIVVSIKFNDLKINYYIVYNLNFF